MTPSTPAPADLARTHEQVILQAAATATGIAAAELRLAYQETFVDAKDPALYGFIVVHQDGFVGISGRLKDGRLTDLAMVKM